MKILAAGMATVEIFKEDDFKHFEQEMTVNGHYLWESRSTSTKANTDEVNLTVKHVRMIDQDYIEEVKKFQGDELVNRKVHTNICGQMAVEQFEKDWKRMWDPDRAVEKLPPLRKRLAETNRHELMDIVDEDLEEMSSEQKKEPKKEDEI